MNDNLHVRIDAGNGFPCRLRFGPANVFGAMNDLPLQVREIHRIEIEDAEFANAGGGQIHRDGRAQSTRADAQHARRADFLLAAQAHFRQDQVSGITADFIIIQFHKRNRAAQPISPREKIKSFGFGTKL